MAPAALLPKLAGRKGTSKFNSNESDVGRSRGGFDNEDPDGEAMAKDDKDDVDCPMRIPLRVFSPDQREEKSVLLYQSARGLATPRNGIAGDSTPLAGLEVFDST